MNCHMCGEREATVHLLDLVAGEQKSVWLCSICASGRVEAADAAEDVDLPALASFLGQVLDGDRKPVRVGDCPSCGYAIARFQENNRLGCPACYDHFRGQVAPILARYHRHASHLGKVPFGTDGKASRQGELTRLRVALEKAIRGEDYEEAARLRDIMRGLGAPADGEDGGDGRTGAEDA